jgi:hypothetical protein
LKFHFERLFDRPVKVPIVRLALIFRSLADRPCALLARWRTIPWSIGQGFQSVGFPSDSGLHGSYTPEPQAHKAVKSDRSFPQYDTDRAAPTLDFSATAYFCGVSCKACIPSQRSPPIAAQSTPVADSPRDGLGGSSKDCRYWNLESGRIIAAAGVTSANGPA